MTQKIRIMRLPHGEGLPLPRYATAGAAGLDLLAALDHDHPQTLEPGQRALIPCGIAFALPERMEAQIRPRSGLALKFGITVLNAPGTIDADYRGEVGAVLINHGAEPYTVRRGERIAQLVIAAHVRIGWHVVGQLPTTDRGGGGFGSTGRGK
jgi:dUTP pyrophosphatase